ncbi:MAG: hypothetical protein ACETWQ_10405, partial [Phycisphaerae bacterium]
MLASRLKEFTPDVSSLAFLSGANRQQAKMTFQFACRKPHSGKDLEPAGPNRDSSIVNSQYSKR